MGFLTKEFQKKIEEEERLNTFYRLQSQLEHEGVIPHGPKLLLRRYQRHLEYVGGGLIGGVIGVFTLFAIFIAINVILHIAF